MTVNWQSATMWKRLTALATAAACSVFISCSSGNAYIPATAANTANNVLTAAEVASILTTAAASVNVPLVLAVSDRRGVVLGVYVKAGASTVATGNFNVPVAADEEALALARTAAYFSNDQAPLSSRTVRFISGVHFPPTVTNTESAPLYGIENTNRGCPFNVTYIPGQSVPPSGLFHAPNSPGLGIQTGKPDIYDSDGTAVNPGGVPIFKNNRVAGGLGVVAAPGIANYNAVVEYAAVAGTVLNGFAPIVGYPGAVVVGGITLPFVNQTSLPAGYAPGTTSGAYTYLPIDSPGPAPEGDLIVEHGSSLGGLTLAQVQQIVQQAVATGNVTRAAIRLPVGSRARFVISVADLDGSLLALYRMPDATIFSIDVAVAKARNVIYWSGPNATGDLPGIPPNTAVTNRTVGYAAQPSFPEGIANTPLGPFFPLFLKDLQNPCTLGSAPPSPNNNGIVFFPGSVPLYVNGKLVGGLGVSGDGVDQDDYATAGGAAGFMAATSIRADNIIINGVRLPFQKFPEDPTN